MRLTFSPLPVDLGLVALYRQATIAILSNISAGHTRARASPALRTLNITYEPGEDSWRVISGQKLQPQSNSADSESRPGPGFEDGLDEGADGEDVPDDGYTYEQERSTAIQILFGELETLLVASDTDSAGLEFGPPFTALCSVGIFVWDTKEGKSDDWWYEAVSKRLPVLHAYGVLRVEVLRKCKGMRQTAPMMLLTIY